MRVTNYNMPQTNSVGCDPNVGAVTAGVGNSNPSFIVSEPIQLNHILKTLIIKFQTYVFDANLNCKSIKLFPCETRAKIILVKPEYTATAAPPQSAVILETDWKLVSTYIPNNNSIAFNDFIIVTDSLKKYMVLNNEVQPYPFRIYLDFKIIDNCNQRSTKYVIDEFIITQDDNVILPVKFSSFTASKKSNAVDLNWETAAEENNKGFNIQRRTRSSDWKTIAFVASKANAGTSGVSHKYSYTDDYLSTTNIQYRIEQEDHDGKLSYSDIRIIKGGANGGIIIYPNPAKSEPVRILLQDHSATYDVTCIDASGRVIKRFSNISGGTVQLPVFIPGMYLISVKNNITQQMHTEKLMVTQ
jgi:hypothetical protein